MYIGPNVKRKFSKDEIEERKNKTTSNSPSVKSQIKFIKNTQKGGNIIFKTKQWVCIPENLEKTEFESS